MEHRDELRRILDSTAVAVPTYADLHWRIDAQVASRTLRHHVQPTVSIKLDMKNAGMRACVCQHNKLFLTNNSNPAEHSSTVLVTDAPTLQRMIAQLENAVREANGSHVRRVMRAIK